MTGIGQTFVFRTMKTIATETFSLRNVVERKQWSVAADIYNPYRALRLHSPSGDLRQSNRSCVNSLSFLYSARHTVAMAMFIALTAIVPGYAGSIAAHVGINASHFLSIRSHINGEQHGA